MTAKVKREKSNAEMLISENLTMWNTGRLQRLGTGLKHLTLHTKIVSVLSLKAGLFHAQSANTLLI
ncbi:MAG: hypothetical protein Q7J27_07670 [Syntrophales bacterium]|nr:hypothetical protein [Syntrophales bacterium]